MKSKCCSALTLLTIALTIFSTMPAAYGAAPSIPTTKNNRPYAIYNPNPTRSFHSANVRMHAVPGCVRLRFDVDASGQPTHINVWSHYPSNLLDPIAVDGLAKWRFHPRVENGQTKAADDLFVEFIYPTSMYGLLQAMRRIVDRPNQFDITLLQVGASFPNISAVDNKPSRHAEQGSSSWQLPHNLLVADVSLAWLCQQPPMHGVVIVAGDAPVTTSSTDDEAPKLGSDSVVYLPRSTLTPGTPKGHVKVRFCIGPGGRARNTVVRDSSLKGVYDTAARRALEQVVFTPRELSGKPVWTCGLTVPVSFWGLGAATGNQVGEIGPLAFQTLSGGSTAPVIKEQRPVKLSLNIPTGTMLPPVAKVELDLCIETNGRVSQARVVKADPPQLFDRAAIETVSGWHYEPPSAKVCDVYEWVKFPLSGG